MRRHALRGAAFSFRADPFLVAAADALTIWDDALIVIEDGRIASIGPYATEAPRVGAIETAHYPDAILSAGFIDAHVHYPQTGMIGAPARDLLDWLDRHTFALEERFADADYAARVARVFVRELLRAGTTTAAVYCTVHPASVDAFFTESARWNTRMIAGKVLMDRNAPEALLDGPDRGIADSQALIDRWHGVGRQLYAVTPRFAPTSSDAQLRDAGTLWAQNPGTYMQTHVSENSREIDWVASLFPDSAHYLDVYHRAGLTGRRAIFGHGIHLSEDEFACCHTTHSALAHCPTSNLFLGSGLFGCFEAKRPDRPVRVGLGSDVGGGTSLSQLQVLGEAYKVAEMNGTKLTAAQSFYLATRGGAEALDLLGTVGSLDPGGEADIVVLDLAPTPLIAFRMERAANWLDRLFVLMTMGDDRAVRATYVAGELVYDRARAEPFRYPAAAAPFSGLSASHS